jgi:hypothetical protein
MTYRDFSDREGRSCAIARPKLDRSKTGRRKGTRNTVHYKAKQLVLEALEEVGGKDWLVALAREEPNAFSKLVLKLVPQEVEAKVQTDTVLRLNLTRSNQTEEIDVTGEAGVRGQIEVGSPEGCTPDVPRNRLEAEGTPEAFDVSAQCPGGLGENGAADDRGENVTRDIPRAGIPDSEPLHPERVPVPELRPQELASPGEPDLRQSDED